jgi:hypothetical protein
VPNLHGKATTVLLGSVNLSPYLDSADLGSDMDVADTTSFGSGWKTAIAGPASSKLDFSGFYDPTQTSVRTLFLSGVPGVLTFAPGSGAAIGDDSYLLSALDVASNISSPVGGVVAIKGSVLANDVVGFGYMLHPLAEDTDTTTGATRDDTAATASGWTAHLHVTVVDGGSWVVKLQDASASNMSDVADVTGGAFTAATGTTSQRLRGATSTTALRRYVRYVATRTGGVGGNGITFALALARN